MPDEAGKGPSMSIICQGWLETFNPSRFVWGHVASEADKDPSMSIICQRWLETFHLQESASYHLFVTTSSKFASKIQIRLSVPWQFIKQKRKLISIHFSSLSSPGANLREATMDNWQGANIQNPHTVGVVLIASRTFPGNNFVHLAIISSPCQPQWRVCVANKLAHTRPP